ncbi:periplasmic heavy metal sensor [Candidatus Albibeggiatoa sp. nov. NOAA]|uniref:periplasmic heavy metal sensor n=1 Tax=Candidatus Albibeggiatoa sp. nov. NOAA TaxID=3162724 RepID=UPI0032F9D1C0|nr:periplasmic heavy metal sensor [Thiotrichaceae bacterium]
MKQQKWFIFALVISLIINIFMAGILLGKHLFQPQKEDSNLPAMMVRPPHPKHFFWMLKQLPEETRQKVEPIVQEQFQRGQMRAEIRQTHRVFREVESLFIADSLDKAAIEQQFRVLQERKNQMTQRLNDGLLLIADQLNQQERQQLMQAIRYSFPFRGKRDHHERRHRDRCDHEDKFEQSSRID